MKHASKLLGAAGTAALMGLATTPAHAAGTLVGTTITNTVSVNFQVSGVAQTAASATNTLLVDRKVNIVVTESGPTTTVAPGQIGAVTKFTVTNSSNDTIDVGLAATSQSNGATAAHGGTVNQAVTTFTYYLDSDNSGTYNVGDQLITYLDELAPDTTKTVFVLANVPAGATNAQIAGIVLTGTAEAGGAASTQGAVLTASTGAWTPNTVQTVLADSAGNGGDANYDGKYTALADYTVSAAVLTVTKLSAVITDPVNGTTNPKSIPGATLEYCIVVANAAGAATATSLSLSDVLPTTVTYSSGFGVLVNGTYNTSTSFCNSDGSATGGSYSATPNPTVSGTLNNLAAGATETLRFRVTIN